MNLLSFRIESSTFSRATRIFFLFTVISLFVFGYSPLVLGQETEGTTYFVRSLEGNDQYDGTSPESAWKNVKQAVRFLGPGATLIIGPGLYREGVQLRKGGLPGQPVRIIGDPSGKLTNDPPGPVVMVGTRPFDETLFEPEGTPGVYMAKFPDFKVLGVVEMDGPQSRYRSVHDPISDIPYLERVRSRKSSFWYEEDISTLYIHTSDEKPPTDHELEVIRSFSGFYMVGKPYVWISGMTFRNFADAGIYFREGSDFGRAFNNIAFGSRQGFRVQNSHNVQIIRNTMFRNENSGVYFLRGSLNGLVQGNFVYENLVGVRFSSESNAGMTNNNLIVDNIHAGLSFEKVIFHTAFENTIKGNQTQLRIRTEPSFFTDYNCYEADTSNGQWLAHDHSPENFKRLVEFNEAYGVDLNSKENGCEISKEKIDVAKLHVSSLEYSGENSP